MNTISYILAFYGLATLIALFLVGGEKYTSTHPESKFGLWWRKNVIADGNKYPFE